MSFCCRPNQKSVGDALIERTFMEDFEKAVLIFHIDYTIEHWANLGIEWTEAESAIRRIASRGTKVSGIILVALWRISHSIMFTLTPNPDPNQDDVITYHNSWGARPTPSYEEMFEPDNVPKITEITITYRIPQIRCSSDEKILLPTSVQRTRSQRKSSE